MTKYRVVMAAGLLATLAACSFKPQIGMSFDDWNRECRSKALSGGTLLERKGAAEVYYCGTQDVLYTFENGALAEVKKSAGLSERRRREAHPLSPRTTRVHEIVGCRPVSMKAPCCDRFLHSIDSRKEGSMSVRGRLRARVVALGVGVLALALPAIASAEGRPPTVRVRGAIETLDGQMLHIKSREGSPVTVALADNYAVSLMPRPTSPSIKPNDYIAVAGIPEANGMIKAQMVQIFPEALRGIAEGHFPWDLTPDSTMTNATVADVVTKVDDRMLTLKYKGGEKTVDVPPAAPIVTLKPGTKDLLIAGCARLHRRGEAAGRRAQGRPRQRRRERHGAAQLSAANRPRPTERTRLPPRGQACYDDRGRNGLSRAGEEGA